MALNVKAQGEPIMFVIVSVTKKKSPNAYKSCPKMISHQKLPKNVGDLGKLSVARGFKKLPKVQ